MKSFGAGSKSHPTASIGPWLVWILLTLVPSEVTLSSVERQGWIFEQFAQPPLPTTSVETRYQSGVSLVNYLDALSAQASTVLDLRYFEIGVKASSRLYLGLTERGRSLERQLQADSKQHTLGIEVARFFSSPSGRYGRLGIGLVHFLPDNRGWIQLAVDTGYLASPSLPWTMQFGFHHFSSLYGEKKFLNAHIHIAKQLSIWEGGALNVGGFVSWLQRTRDVGKEAGIPALSFEHMLFSLGPFARLQSGSWHFKVSLPMRLWLDKELFDRAGVTLTGYPSEVTQDLCLTASILF